MTLRRIYHPDAADPNVTQPSWWEASADPMKNTPEPITGSVTCDIAIIGGGFTGLNAALHLAKAGKNVVVADSSHVGWGASGRNGGFCASTSSKMGFGNIAKKYGLDGARDAYRVQMDAIEQVRTFITDKGQPQHTPDAHAELAVSHSPFQQEMLREESAELKSILGLSVPVLGKEELTDIGAGSDAFFGGLIEPWGFALHPLNYVRSLADAALDAGATLSSFTEVQNVRKEADLHVLSTPRGEIRASKIIVATNGYTAETVPSWSRGRLLPAVSSILVTRPITKDEQDEQGWTTHHQTYDTRTLLHYFRLLPDNRMMFGGRGANSGHPAEQQAFFTELRKQFEDIFPHWSGVETEYQWSGFVCLNWKKSQYLGPIDGDQTAFASIAYHGSGVAMASWSGKTVAQILLGEKSMADVPQLYSSPAKRFPLSFLRPQYLKMAYGYYRRQDKR